MYTDTMPEELMEKNIFECGRDVDRSLVLEVLKGPNENAVQLLDVCRCKGVLPVVGYATMADIAKSYNVKEGYLRSVLSRAGINASNSPEIEKGAWIAKKFEENVPDKYTVTYIPKSKTYIIHNRGGARKEYRFLSTRYFYSAKLYVALAALMVCGRSIPQKSRAKTVYEALRNSDYYLAVERQYKNTVLLREAQNTMKIDADSAHFTPSGELIIAPEAFSQYLEQAVDKAIRASICGMLAGIRKDD